MQSAIFKLILWTDILSTSYKIVVMWIEKNLTDDESMMVQEMAWCHQATSHYQNQCLPRFMSPYGIIRPQSIKKCFLEKLKHRNYSNQCLSFKCMCTIQFTMIYHRTKPNILTWSLTMFKHSDSGELQGTGRVGTECWTQSTQLWCPMKNNLSH